MMVVYTHRWAASLRNKMNVPQAYDVRVSVLLLFLSLTGSLDTSGNVSLYGGMKTCCVMRPSEIDSSSWEYQVKLEPRL
jgi:hypothetical protein